MPALLTRMSVSSVSSSRARLSARSTTQLSPPMSAATARAASSSTSATTTWAPSEARRWAVARPMPLAPPVTTARLPVRLSLAHGVVSWSLEGAATGAVGAGASAVSMNRIMWSKTCGSISRGRRASESRSHRM